MPEFKMVLRMPDGWYELYHDGKVYWCEYLVGTRPADAYETRVVTTLWHHVAEMFQTNNSRRSNNE